MMYKYEHGGDIYTEKLTKDGRPFVDYSANINPLGLPLGIKQAVQQALKLCINYPDPFCRELAEVTASYLQLPQEYIFIANGAADVSTITISLSRSKHSIVRTASRSK